MIPFELHITVTDIEQQQLNPFTNFCTQLGGKPLLIELARGDSRQQPMFNKICNCIDLKYAVELANEYTKALTRQGYVVNRRKIEVPAYCHTQVADENKLQNTDYFEWHGKVDFVNPSLLLSICEQNGAHLSKSGLKENTAQRFITLREFGDKITFDNRISALIKTLEKNDYTVHKQQAEYCVYDTNVLLDKGWLPK